MNLPIFLKYKKIGFVSGKDEIDSRASDALQKQFSGIRILSSPYPLFYSEIISGKQGITSTAELSRLGKEKDLDLVISGKLNSKEEVFKQTEQKIRYESKCCRSQSGYNPGTKSVIIVDVRLGKNIFDLPVHSIAISKNCPDLPAPFIEKEILQQTAIENLAHEFAQKVQPHLATRKLVIYKKPFPEEKSISDSSRDLLKQGYSFAVAGDWENAGKSWLAAFDTDKHSITLRYNLSVYYYMKSQPERSSDLEPVSKPACT